MLVVALCTASNSGSRVHSMKGGAKVIIEPHRHPGVFVARGKEDALVTLNMVPGKTVYGEKTVKVDDAEGKKVEYRVWNPFRSKLAAAIVGGVENIWMGPGSKVLYLGAASGTTVSHVSDLVGPVRSLCAWGVQSIGGEKPHTRLCRCRRELCTLWSSHIGPAATSSTWPRTGQMSSPSSRMPATLSSTACS